MSEKTTVYLVRHAQAEGNHKRIFQGFTDAEISEIGEKQLERLAERFREIELDCIYASPLIRTMKTAMAVNRYHDLPIEVDERLKEINGGEWEGQFWSTFPEKYPEINDNWENHPERFQAIGGESMQELYERVSRAVLDIVGRNRGKRIAIVSHGCAIRNMLCFLTYNDIGKLQDVDWCDNTAINLFEFDENLKSRQLLRNCNRHLTDDISTFAHQDWWRKDKE
ncbi:histidine phosphatase family protein [Candidatus Soleaferrea massiliensis]|uniref:histidine phosphatase family protein n=1 Tax=Candidatus Soleaferrea massiliensis TaxID=1470354 RepID=UPI000590D8F6|nr:histidine phosphatase family protein [Candidatus Soleaferrea massiliensis]